MEIMKMASEQLSQEYKLLFHEIHELWIQAPPPQKEAIVESSRAAYSNIEAVALMHGWMNRTLRTGQAALLLSESGYSAEIPPLIRSMLEHAIGLHWVADQRGVAFQVLLRKRSRDTETLRRAQSEGWKIQGADADALMQQAIEIETDSETIIYDSFKHVAHQARETRLGDLYQAWILETGSSHATIVSAMPYYTIDVIENIVNLHLIPLNTGSEVEASVAIASLTAFYGYKKILNFAHLEEKLAKLHMRLEELNLRLQQENKIVHP